MPESRPVGPPDCTPIGHPHPPDKTPRWFRLTSISALLVMLTIVVFWHNAPKQLRGVPIIILSLDVLGNVWFNREKYTSLKSALFRWTAALTLVLWSLYLTLKP